MTRRPHNPTKAVLVNSLAAIGAVVVFFGVLHLADQDDRAAATLDALDAQAQAAEHRLQRAAALLCQAELGPGAQVLWTVDGDLVCRPALLTAEVTP